MNGDQVYCFDEKFKEGREKLEESLCIHDGENELSLARLREINGILLETSEKLVNNEAELPELLKAFEASQAIGVAKGWLEGLKGKRISNNEPEFYLLQEAWETVASCNPDALMRARIDYFFNRKPGFKYHQPGVPMGKVPGPKRQPGTHSGWKPKNGTKRERIERAQREMGYR